MEEPMERQRAVLGGGPRIMPLGLEEFSEEAMEITHRMTAASAGPKIPTSLDDVPEIIPTLLRHPQLFRILTDFGLQLLGRGLLPDRERELAILRMAWISGAPYEWGEHVEIAKRIGIVGGEIAAIKVGSSHPSWDEHDQAVIRSVEELHEDAMISDATWSTLEKKLSQAQLIELPVLIGQYQTVAYFQNTLRLRLHPGNRGLAAE